MGNCNPSMCSQCSQGSICGPNQRSMRLVGLGQQELPQYQRYISTWTPGFDLSQQVLGMPMFAWLMVGLGVWLLTRR